MKVRVKVGAHSLSAVKRGTGLKPKTVLVSERLSSHHALGSLGHQFITKGDNSGTATKKIHRARYEGSGEEFPYPLWVHWNLYVFNNLEVWQ